MKRAHRRAHVIFWLLIAPATAAGLALALARAPADAIGDIPPFARSEGAR
ncbi:MAG: hypothetical protein ACKVS5_03570 [Parvularculaceae bacterium]